MAEIDLRDQNNVIRDMLPHKPMRLSMENKNLLSKKGDIYVGTGKSQTVTIEDDTYTIAETARVSVPSELNESAILIYDTANNLQYKKSSESGFVTYGVEQGLSDEQKITARNNIGAAAASDLTFLSYKDDQTKIIVDGSGQEPALKTTLLHNIFNGLTGSQKDYVRSQIGAGAAQSITGITAGDGIIVGGEAYSPKVSVNLAQNSGMEFSSNQLKLKIGTVTGEKNYAVKLQNGIPYVNVPWTTTTYTGGSGISVANKAISVNLAQNSGLVFDSSLPKGLKLNVNTSSQPENNKYWVQIDSNNNHPYVNVSVPSSDNQTIAYARTIDSFYDPDIVTFSSDARVRLVPGNNISMTADTSKNYIQINATGTQYTGGDGISISGKTISLAEGYNVPIEYRSEASSTADFASNKLYLIGTWGVQYGGN